ncbi:hypothetical protein [Helicobacter sp. 23-1045]
MLEAEKRGSPPKSEKAAAFWRVGGAGRGVQPFLRKKTSESNPKNGETIADSANLTRDSSPTAQNDNFVDCHDSAFAESRNDGNSALDSAIRTKNTESCTKIAESKKRYFAWFSMTIFFGWLLHFAHKSYGLPRFCYAKSRNDGNITDSAIYANITDSAIRTKNAESCTKIAESNKFRRISHESRIFSRNLTIPNFNQF